MTDFDRGGSMKQIAIQVGRRQFLKILGAGGAGLTATAMGLAPTPARADGPRPYTLLRAKETRNNCT